MTQPDARQLAQAALQAHRRAEAQAALKAHRGAESGLDFAEVAAAALVAIAAALTETAPGTTAPNLAAADDEQPCCATSDDGYLCTRPIGHTGQHQADDGEGRICATWADTQLPPVLTGDATEVRQPTGLNRLLTEPTPAHLPGNIVVRPTEWSVWSEDRTVYYGLVSTSDGGGPAKYSTYRGDGVNVGDHPSLAAAVAYLIQRRTEDTEDAS